MMLFATSLASIRTWSGNEPKLLYLGSDLTAAQDIVGDFRRNRKNRSEGPDDMTVRGFSALPDDLAAVVQTLYMDEHFCYVVERFNVA